MQTSYDFNGKHRCAFDTLCDLSVKVLTRVNSFDLNA